MKDSKFTTQQGRWEIEGSFGWAKIKVSYWESWRYVISDRKQGLTLNVELFRWTAWHI